MNPILVTLIVIAFIALLVVQQVIFERNLQRARENHTGLFRYSPHVRRVIVVAIIAAVIPLTIWQWQLCQ